MHDKWREIKAAIGQGQTRPWSKTLVQVSHRRICISFFRRINLIFILKQQLRCLGTFLNQFNHGIFSGLNMRVTAATWVPISGRDSCAKSWLNLLGVTVLAFSLIIMSWSLARVRARHRHVVSENIFWIFFRKFWKFQKNRINHHNRQKANPNQFRLGTIQMRRDPLRRGNGRVFLHCATDESTRLGRHASCLFAHFRLVCADSTGASITGSFWNKVHFFLNK